MTALAGRAARALAALPERPMLFLQRRLGVQRMGYVFLLPNLLLFSLFTFAPMLLNGWYALTVGDEIAPARREYAGLENFQLLLDCGDYRDPNSCRAGGDFFWRGLWNTGFFVAVQVGLMTGISLVTALVLNRKIFARGFWRAVFFYPVMLSPVVVALIWKWILERRGILNSLVEFFGGEPVNWLIAPPGDWAMFWVVFISVWAHMGFYTLILLAGLQSIPFEIYEAAEMDGAGGWRKFRRITLPLLTPTLLVVVLLAMIKAFQVFDEVWVLTGGGPGTATTFVMQFIYSTGFSDSPRRFGLAAAASFVLAGIVLAFTLAQLRISRSRLGG